MIREISAGGVVIHRKDGAWWMAAIQPAGESVLQKPQSSPKKRAVQPKTTLCLPKGLVDPGEKALEAALREVHEETGITASSVT